MALFDSARRAIAQLHGEGSFFRAVRESIYLRGFSHPPPQTQNAVSLSTGPKYGGS